MQRFYSCCATKHIHEASPLKPDLPVALVRMTGLRARHVAASQLRNAHDLNLVLSSDVCRGL